MLVNHPLLPAVVRKINLMLAGLDRPPLTEAETLDRNNFLPRLKERNFPFDESLSCGQRSQRSVQSLRWLCQTKDLVLSEDLMADFEALGLTRGSIVIESLVNGNIGDRIQLAVLVKSASRYDHYLNENAPSEALEDDRDDVAPLAHW